MATFVISTSLFAKMRNAASGIEHPKNEQATDAAPRSLKMSMMRWVKSRASPKGLRKKRMAPVEFVTATLKSEMRYAKASERPVSMKAPSGSLIALPPDPASAVPVEVAVSALSRLMVVSPEGVHPPACGLLGNVSVLVAAPATSSLSLLLGGLLVVISVLFPSKTAVVPAEALPVSMTLGAPSEGGS